MASSAGLGPTGTVVMPGVPPKQPPPGGGAWKPQNPGYAVAAVAVSLGVILLFFAVNRHRERLRSAAERESEPQAAEVSQESDFDALADRVREELNRASIRFSDMQLSAPADNSMIVTFSGLEELALIDGTNAWRSIGGPLAAERREGDRWEFQGQDKLQTVRFDMSEADPAGLLDQSRDHPAAAAREAIKTAREGFKERLAAASEIRDLSSRNGAIVAVATDAAKAGEPDIVKSSLREITDFTLKNETSFETVRLLAKTGKRKQAFEIARDIEDPGLRDKALSDLAQ
jgi:hypothetical protein